MLLQLRFLRFLRFFWKFKKRDFLRFCFASHVFWNYDLGQWKTKVRVTQEYQGLPSIILWVHTSSLRITGQLLTIYSYSIISTGVRILQVTIVI